MTRRAPAPDRSARRAVGRARASSACWRSRRARRRRTGSPAPETLSLDQAMQYAVDHYPAVRAALETSAASAAGVRVARAGYLPRLDSLWQSNRATANNVFGQVLPQSVMPAMSGPVLPAASGQSVWGSATGALFSWEPVDFGLRAAVVAGAQAALSARQGRRDADAARRGRRGRRRVLGRRRGRAPGDRRARGSRPPRGARPDGPRARRQSAAARRRPVARRRRARRRRDAPHPGAGGGGDRAGHAGAGARRCGPEACRSRRRICWAGCRQTRRRRRRRGRASARRGASGRRGRGAGAGGGARADRSAAPLRAVEPVRARQRRESERIARRRPRRARAGSRELGRRRAGRVSESLRLQQPARAQGGGGRHRAGARRRATTKRC